MSTIELQNEIRKLLKDRRAILLAHYYQQPEIQEIADILGDSLALSVEAAGTDAEVIVFAGVHFMAESASILSPEKTVLLPRLDAGCPLADMVTAADLREMKKKYSGLAVVSYVNSSAAVKAESDICCTSANAAKVVNSLERADRVLMVPDGNLARYTAGLTEKNIVPWNGYCPVHHFLAPEEVISAKERHPQAVFAAHPECRGEVLAMADYVGSTAGIIKYARESGADEIIIGTENGILHPLAKQNPRKKFVLASEKLICPTMKSITLPDILDVLKEMKNVVKVPDEVRIPAARALGKMLALR
ncbi:MAG: quinolinate synthase NadA [Syntrophales bacterium]